MDRPEDIQPHLVQTANAYRPEDIQIHQAQEANQNPLIAFLTSLLPFFDVDDSDKKAELSPSKQYDNQYDWRQPTIDALAAEANATGNELPANFVRSLFNCSNPYWIDGDSRIPIFSSDGSINPDAHAKIMAGVADGSLEKEARVKDEHYRSQMARLEGSRDDILDAVEQRTGLELNIAIREELEKTGVFSFTDNHGRHREINLNGTDATLIAGEIRELTALHGGTRDVDFSDVAASQARGVRNIINEEKGRS